MDEFKLSKYNIVFGTENDDILLFNAMTGAVARLDKEKQIELDAFSKQGGNIDREFLSLLQKNGFICKKSFDETGLIKKTKLLAVNDEKNQMDLIILTTLKCNFGCKYCYEKRRCEDLDETTISKIKKYLSKIILQYDKINIYWYGGEPLCNFNAISSITQYLTQLNNQYNKKILFGITTNGYLLDGYADKLYNLGIKKYQITIDGNEENHNINRPLTDGSPTYRKIIDNVKLLLKRTDNEIVLRVNFNEKNLRSVQELLEEFKQVENKKQIILSLEPIFGESAFACDMDQLHISREMIEIYALAEKMGLRTLAKDMFSLRPHKAVYCYATKKSQLSISPKGNLFKCTGSDFSEKCRCGYLNDQGNTVFNEKYNEWLDKCKTFPPICEACKFLPLCIKMWYNQKRTDLLNSITAAISSIQNEYDVVIPNTLYLRAHCDKNVYEFIYSTEKRKISFL